MHTFLSRWVPGGSSTTYTDAGVTEGTTYRYAVESRRVDWGSQWVFVTARGPGPTQPFFSVSNPPRDFVARASSNLVALNWNYPWWDGDDLRGLKSYTLYRGNGQSCEELGEYKTDIPPSTTYLEDIDVSAGQHYCYQLTAINIFGESAPTDAKAVKLVNPGDPQDLTVVTGNTGIIGLSWTPSPEDGGGPVDGYNVYRCVGSDCALTNNDWLAWVPVDEGTYYSDRRLTTGTEYRYAVGAVRAKVFSGWTNEVAFRLGAAAVVQPGSIDIMPVTIVGVARTTTEIISISADSGVPAGTLLELPPIDESLNLWAVKVTSENAEGSMPDAPIGLVHAVDRVLQFFLDKRGIGSIKELPSAATICIPLNRIGVGANPGTVAFYRTTSDGQSWTAMDVVHRPGMLCGATQQFTRFAVFGQPATRMSAELQARGSANRVALDWSEAVFGGNTEVTRYTLYRGKGDTCDNFEVIQEGLARHLRYVEDESVSADTTYCYRLTATGSTDETLESNDQVVRAVTASMPTDLRVTTRNEAMIGLSWTAPPDDGGGPPYGYNVYRCEGTDCQFDGETWLAWVTDGTTYTDDGGGSRPLTAQATYRYAVATSRAGEISVWSNWVTATATSTQDGGEGGSAAPSAPTGLSASGGSSKVALSWQAPEVPATGGLTGYTLYRSDDGSCENLEAIQENLSADIVNVEDDTVSADTTYCYRVSASNEVGEGPQSDDAVVRTVGSGDYISTAEKEALEDVSVSMARSMLSSVIPTIRRRFGETSDLSSVSIAGRNVKPGQDMEEWASTSLHVLPQAGAPWHAVGSGSGTSFVDSSGWGLVPTVMHGSSDIHGPRAANRTRHGAFGAAQVLSDSHFALGFGASADHDPSCTLWGSSDVQYFGGDPGGSSRFEGEMLTGHFGIDAKVGGNHLLGLAITHTIGDADFLTTDRDGRVGMEVTTVLPYGRFLFNEQTEAWIILGTGSGERTAAIGDDLQQSVQLTPQVSAFGGRRELGRGSNGIKWQVHGDAASMRLQSDDTLAVDTHRIRLGLEGSTTFVLQNAATVRPFVEMSVRVDGGDGSINGTGVETVGGVQYRHPTSRFWLEAQGRALTMRSAGDYEERGISLTAGLQPRDDGTGLSLRFSPQFGAMATSTQALWRDDALDNLLGQALGRRQHGKSWRAEVGYGLFAPHTGGLLTPFSELNVLSETQRQARLGARYLNSTNDREVSLEVSSDVVTTSLPNIGSLDPRDESIVQLRLRGQLRF